MIGITVMIANNLSANCSKLSSLCSPRYLGGYVSNSLYIYIYFFLPGLPSVLLDRASPHR